MKLFSVLIALGMLGAATARDTADGPYGTIADECNDLCKKAYSGRTSECEDACDRCRSGRKKGYVPKTLYEVPPDCKAVCGQDPLCIEQCGAFQAACCHSAFGCCPHDPRLCVCVPGTFLEC
ncbi:hypothetical protein V8E36_008876 [Tilletia maclaganii]